MKLDLTIKTNNGYVKLVENTTPAIILLKKQPHLYAMQLTNNSKFVRIAHVLVNYIY